VIREQNIVSFHSSKLLSKEFYTKFDRSNDQLVDELTKSLKGPQIEFICCKISTWNFYTPAWRTML